jgi:hypothetical protein
MITILPGFTIMPIHSAADDAAYRGAAAKMIQLVKLLHEQGTFLVAGSDDNDGSCYNVNWSSSSLPDSPLARRSLERRSIRQITWSRS